MVDFKEVFKRFYAASYNRIAGVNRKKILFISFSGKSYSDNPRAISEALHEMDETIEINWAFSDPEKKKTVVPGYIKLVNRNKNFEYYRAVASSRVFVSNFSFLEPKGKEQYFLQTWHGDRAFKKILYDANPIRNREISESKEGFCDLALAGSAYGVMQYTSAFRYKGEILQVGTPRNDVLVNGDLQRANAVRNNLGISQQKKILLYAPTLRAKNLHGQGKQEIQDIDIERTLDKLENKYHCEWVCLMRAHPVMAGLSGFKVSSRIINVSEYEDMTDLLLVSDILITDYSSCAGDFALTHRPVLLYQSDRKQYLDHDREFYFNMEDSPYWIAENQEELEILIDNINRQEGQENCDKILDFYKTTETGEASKAAAKRILEWVNM